MAVNPKLLGGLILAAGAAVLFASGSAGASKRPPYKLPIPVPGKDAPWDDVDAALCLCAEADTPEADVPLCALARVYPEVPWPAQPGDDPSVLATEQAVRDRWANTDGLCIEQPDPDPQDPDDPGPIEDPVVPSIGRYEGQGGGYFWPVQAGDNLITVVRKVWGLPSGHRATQALCEMVTRSLANLSRYSRRENEPSFGYQRIDGQWYSVAPVFYQRNAASSFLESGRWPQRTVSLSGSSTGDGSSYGQLWLPKAELVGTQPVLAGGVTPDELPPDDVRLLPSLQWLSWATGKDDGRNVLRAQFAGDTAWKPPVPPAQPVSAPVGGLQFR